MRALRTSLGHYTEAQQLAAAETDPAMFYPALNQLAIALAVAQIEETVFTFDKTLSAAITRCLENNAVTNADFWTYAGLIEIDLHSALADGTIVAKADGLIARLKDLYGRDSAPGNWRSLRDQLDFVLERAPAEDIAATENLRQIVKTWSN